MANLVQNRNEFEACTAMLSERIGDISFENNPFKEHFKCFLGFEFDFIYHELFFEGIKRFLQKINNQSVIFYTIDPSPEKYFFHHFGKYSVFEISNTATDDELNEVMTQDPGGSPADSLNTNSDVISWFSRAKSWAILGSREWEIAVVGFENQEIKQKFIESFSEDAQTMFTTIQVQSDALDEMLCFNNEAKEAYQNLVKNYGDRVT